MTEPETGPLYVRLSASQVRRKLKGHGLGVQRIESAGKNRAAIFHTATGLHLRQLRAVFQGLIETNTDNSESR
jgi:DNA transformation protein and related proteins